MAVYFSQFMWLRKNRSIWPVNRPTSRKGSTKPSVYTPISTKPSTRLSEEPASSSTLVRVGPTQGVQAKLKVKPMTSAGMGPIAHLSSRKGSRSSLVEMPPKNSCHTPISSTTMPPATVNAVRYRLKNCPRAVKPIPSRKNAKLMPSTKKKVLSRVRRRAALSSAASGAPPAR